MDTQHCLQCEYSQTKYDQYGSKYCYCFYTDKGIWVAEIKEIKECPKAIKEE